MTQRGLASNVMQDGFFLDRFLTGLRGFVRARAAIGAEGGRFHG